MKRILAVFAAISVLMGVFSLSALAAENGSARVLSEGYVETNFGKPINIFLDYNYIALNNRPIFVNDDFVIVPVEELCKVLGINYSYDVAEQRVHMWIENKYAVSQSEVVLTINSASAEVFGETKRISMPAVLINGAVYAPLRAVSDAFKVEVAFFDESSMYNINLSQSVLKMKMEAADAAEAQALERVRNIKSQTDYLVYVSKPEYLVRVYLKGDNGWFLVKRFDCAIGAPDTPTVEGQFTYYQQEDLWDYGTYYVGPVMRFYHGYALHSTLLKKDGTPYDNRTGVKISHGCVRLKKPDIEWMAAYVPLKTKIYVA